MQEVAKAADIAWPLDADVTNATLKELLLPEEQSAASAYIRQHPDNTAIAKLKGNRPLEQADVEALEQILWSEIGTKQDYEEECGEKPLGEFVREIVGLDMAAAKEAFAEYLNDTNLDKPVVRLIGFRFPFT